MLRLGMENAVFEYMIIVSAVYYHNLQYFPYPIGDYNILLPPYPTQENRLRREKKIKEKDWAETMIM
jgi:hypothetical protein